MNIRVALMIAVGLVQLAVPGWMIFEQEQTLRLGTEYKFQTEPVDPYDIFRGRYVALRFKAEDYYPADSESHLLPGSEIYVALKINAEGFAEVKRISKTPINGENTFRATIGSKSQYKVFLYFPFERYYMEETRAPAAEAAYRKANLRNSKQQTWAVVRVHNGNAALADLMIDGQPIRDHPQPKK